MNIRIFKQKEVLFDEVAHHFIKKIKQADKITLGLATGSTPIELYHRLVKDYKKHHTSYKHVTTFNLDEYVGYDMHNKDSYATFMHKQLFLKLNLLANQTHIPNGASSDLQMECLRYDRLLQENPIDLQLLGIGVNGHIGFNEPKTSFDLETHIVNLSFETRQANTKFFKDINEVPTQAITMGIKQIMNAKEIVLIAIGKDKAEAILHTVDVDINEEWPSSILKEHPNVTLYLDEAAASLID